jgi:hypothetical protein
MTHCENCGRVLSSETSECPDCALAFSEQYKTVPISTKRSEEDRNAGGAAVAFFILAPSSLFLMMWWGFGGYNAVTPEWLHSVFVQVIIYLSIELFCVQGVLFWATRTTRMGALFGFLSPWIIPIVLAIPQVSSAPRDVLLLLIVPALGFAVHVVAEEIGRKANHA